MPLILPSNSISAVGYEVDNSLRFESSSTDHLSRSKSSSETSTTIGTFSFWVKRCETGATTSIYSNEVEDGNNRGFIIITNTDNFYVNNSVSGQSDRVFSTTQLFRDLSAWSHFVVAFDTNQGTASNRVKIYHNGNQITAFSTAVYPNQSENLKILEGGQTNKELVGKIYGADNSRMYLAEFHHIDGQALTPTDFGEFDEDSGIWKPIEYSGTYGNNGFYLDFENSGSLGADVSGNGNNFTVNNLTSIDQTTDTPTNNYCTLNPLDFGYNATANATFSEGNLKATGNTSAWRGSHGTMGVSKGKWYFEGKAIGVPDGDTGVYIGWCDPALATTYNPGNNNASYNLYVWTNGTIKSNTSSTSSYYTFTENDICGFALDLDNGKGYISKNGTFYNNNNTSSTPDTNNPDFTVTISSSGSGVLVPCIIAYNDGGFFCNFGNPPFTISSGNSDGNGYGNFEYAVPSGYYALNTKNLAEFG